MAFFQTRGCALLTMIIFLCLGYADAARDICSKFAIGGPCLLLNPVKNVPTVPPTKASTDSAYCSLACAQNKTELFNSICSCGTVATTVTTTTIPTTTQRPVTCYYSAKWPTRLSGRTRRLYSSTPVLKECEYPGVVSLIWEEDGDLYVPCTALLLDEDTLLISNQCYNTSIADYPPTFAMAHAYKLSEAKLEISVDPASAVKLGDEQGYFYTIKTSSPLTFDNACVQPVCVPNVNIRSDDINFDDCRIVGYGQTEDEQFGSEKELMEIKVTVDPSSISNSELTVTRIDKKVGMACNFGDETSPLICSHKYTEDWITVGVTVTTGFPCSTGTFTFPAVASLLKESKNNNYDSLQHFKYMNPETFLAGVQE